ncbi:hypothetical protein AAZX31_04G162600 [Glycine max]
MNGGRSDVAFCFAIFLSQDSSSPKRFHYLTPPFSLSLSRNPYSLSPRATAPSLPVPNPRLTLTSFPPTRTSTSSPSTQAAVGSEPLASLPTTTLLSPSANFLSPLSPSKPLEVSAKRMNCQRETGDI